MVTKKSTRLTRKQKLYVSFILIGILAILVIMLLVMGTLLTNREGVKDSTVEQVRQYTYKTTTADNGMVLHVIKTKPSNITLEAVHNNVALTNKAGINGGFFYGADLLSISVVNGKAVNGNMSEYGSGGENAKYDRGTLVWDGASNSLNVQVVANASQVKVKDHTRFWAQGGVSMSLGNDEGWFAQAEAENAPFADGEHWRSGAVYDEMGFIYLIVTETKGTLASFREAIIETVGNGRLVDGIFLDGDGSSQMLSKEKIIAGDQRAVVQMIRVVR